MHCVLRYFCATKKIDFCEHTHKSCDNLFELSVLNGHVKHVMVRAYNSEQQTPMSIRRTQKKSRSTPTKKKILFDTHIAEHLKQKPTERRSKQSMIDNSTMRCESNEYSGCWTFQIGAHSKSENDNLIIYGNHVAHINANCTEQKDTETHTTANWSHWIWQLISPI